MHPELFASAAACDWSIQFCRGRTEGAVTENPGAKDVGGPVPVSSWPKAMPEVRRRGRRKRPTSNAERPISNGGGRKRRTPNAERRISNAERPLLTSRFSPLSERLQRRFGSILRLQ